MKYKIDVVRIRENSITLNGWAIGRSPESRATFRVEEWRVVITQEWEGDDSLDVWVP